MNSQTQIAKMVKAKKKLTFIEKKPKSFVTQHELIQHKRKLSESELFEINCSKKPHLDLNIINV